MTLGFSKPFTSLIIGSRGTIGAAFVKALNEDPNCESVVEINRTTYPSFDLRNEQGMEIALSSPEFSGPFDLIVDATGALTMGSVGPENLFMHSVHQH